MTGNSTPFESVKREYASRWVPGPDFFPTMPKYCRTPAVLMDLPEGTFS